MASEAAEDVWGDEDFLNALILATENATAAAASSSGGGVGGGASLPPPGDLARRTPGDGVPVSSRSHAITSTSSWYSPSERQLSTSLLPPPPRPVRVASRAPPPVSLGFNGTQALWQEWDDPFAAGNVAMFDGGVDTRGYDFSPPRELSQREKRTESNCVAEDWKGITPGSPKNAGRDRNSARRVRVEKEKDKEIERLKREMDQVLKKLDCMERECHELQEDRAKKDKELECAFSEILAKNVEIESLKKEILLPSKENHPEVPVAEKKLSDVSDEPVAPLSDPSLELCFSESYGKKRKNIRSVKPSPVSELKGCIVNDGTLTSNERFIQGECHPKESVQRHHTKAIGVQTDGSNPAIGECSPIHHISSKLLSIWGPTTEGKSGRHFISRLLECCSADLCTLFRFTGVPSNINMDFMTDGKFTDVGLDDIKNSVQSAEAQKVSHLYSIMMKMRNGMVQLDDLLEALTELCVLGNVLVLYRSLRILHEVLRIISFKQTCQRDNIVITPSSDNILLEAEGETGALDIGIKFHVVGNACDTGQTSVSLPSRSFSLQNPGNDRHGISRSSSLSLNRQISLYKSMHKIIVSNTKTNVLVEAISIMNLILQRSHPILEREKLGLIPSFASVSHLLSREVDLCAKRQAVKLLFLLLNCPKHLKVFCNGCNSGNEVKELGDGDDEASRLHQSINTVLRGLADCIDHRGNSTQDLVLCREVVILLAFLASSGKSGFEILLNPVTKRGNFLRLIIEVLASQMEIAGCCEPQDLHKERAALIREALILLNRLSSNSAYSKPTLGALTQSTAMATMAMDVATRICHKWNGRSPHDSAKRAPMGAEVADLARLFRTRMLSFLGEDSS